MTISLFGDMHGELLHSYEYVNDPEASSWEKPRASAPFENISNVARLATASFSLMVVLI